MLVEYYHMKELSYKLFFKAFSNKTRFEIIDSLRKGSTLSEAIKLTAQSFYKDVNKLSCCTERW